MRAEGVCVPEVRGKHILPPLIKLTKLRLFRAEEIKHRRLRGLWIRDSIWR